MKREVKDHTVENIDEIGYKHNDCPSKLYIFYQFIKKENFIVIYANSYLEAKALLYSINPYADYVYNLTEYKLQHVDPYKLFSICKIAPEWEYTPTFVNKKEYNKLQKYIIDKKDSNDTKVLTKNLLNKLSSDKNKYWTTDEFVKYLKTNSEDNIHIKEQIEDYLCNKYPLLKTHIITRGINFDLYTNSSEQTEAIMNKMREYDNNIHADYRIYNEKFITGTDINSINNYKELNKILKDNNCSFKDVKTPFFMFGNNYQEYNSYMLPKKEN